MIIGRRCPREHPKGTSDRACTLAYFPGEALRVTFDRILCKYWLRMRAHYPSKETRRSDVTLDDVISGEKATIGRILRNSWLRMRTPLVCAWAQLTQGNSLRRDVWWRHLRWKGPTRADIDLRSLPVVLVLVLLYYTLYYYYSKKKGGKKPRMHRTYFRDFRSRYWGHFRLGMLTRTRSLPVRPPSRTTTWNAT